MQRAPDEVLIVRGGGDLATGVIWRLHHAGFKVLVTELATPLAIRQTVAFSSAIVHGRFDVEGLTAQRCENNTMIEQCWQNGEIPVVVAPTLDEINIGSTVLGVIDVRLAKRPLDTSVTDAPIVIGVGPGFIVGEHCHAIVESMRGHRLGRALFTGSAEPNTGSPGMIEGKSAERVIRSRHDGTITWKHRIGDWVPEGTLLGVVTGVETTEIRAPFTGMIRGLITSGCLVTTGLKIADIDPRHDTEACVQISDKALAIGGGVLEAVLRLRNAS